MSNEEGMPEEGQWDGVDRRVSSQNIKIPIVMLGVIVAILGQSVAGVIWLGQLSSKVDRAVDTINEFKLERYTREDARREREIVDGRLELQRQADRDFDRRLSEVEAALRATSNQERGLFRR